MMALLTLALLAQAPTTTIADPAVLSKKVTTTTDGAKQRLDTSTTVSGSVTTAPATTSSASNPGTCVSVTTSTTVVLAANATRKKWSLKATDSNTARVRCKLGATATSSNMPFAAGDAYTEDTGTIYTGVVECVATSGTQEVCPWEL